MGVALSRPPRFRIPQWLPATVGVVISVGVGVFFYQQTGNNAVFGAFAGLLGTTISLQLEILLQQRRLAADELRRERLMAQVETIQWLPELLERAVASLNIAGRTQISPITAILGKQIFDDCAAQCEDLQRGTYVVRPTDDSWLYETLTEHSNVVVRATCPDFAEELDWWESPAARVYLTAQRDAVQRGVKVQRIFIYREWTDRVADLMTKQRSLGIETLRIERSALRGKLPTSAFIIWDEACAQHLEVNADSVDGGYYTTQYTVAPQDIKRIIRGYRQIESSSEPWPS